MQTRPWPVRWSIWEPRINNRGEHVLTVDNHILIRKAQNIRRPIRKHQLGGSDNRPRSARRCISMPLSKPLKLSKSSYREGRQMPESISSPFLLWFTKSFTTTVAVLKLWSELENMMSSEFRTWWCNQMQLCKPPGGRASAWRAFQRASLEME